MSTQKTTTLSTPRGAWTAPTVTALGALFASAAFVCALPYCWSLISHALVAAAYIVVVSLIALASVRVPRRTVTYCLFLGFLALTPRILWAFAAHVQPQSDFLEYRQMSLGCLHGDWYELLHTCSPWGYPLYLFALARLFGTSLCVPLIANAVVGSATTLLVYAIARRLYAEPLARLAAAAYALWPGVILWSSLLCSEIPHLLFYASALFCLIAAVDAPAAPCLDGRWNAWPIPDSLKSPRGRWLVAGGVLLAAAEFIRPFSLLMLLPFAFHALARSGQPSESLGAQRRPRGWQDIKPTLAAYVVCLGILLTIKSVATGYPNFSVSYYTGNNLAVGLNWEARGTYNETDEIALSPSKNPRVVVRVGLQLALKRLAAMGGNIWWRLPALACMKFPIVWSSEGMCYNFNAEGQLPGKEKQHWLAVQGKNLRALAQYYHTLILIVAAVGFWRGRRSKGLALLSGILVAFVLLHTVIEVQDRYHYAVQLMLAIASANAFACHKTGRVKLRSCQALDGASMNLTIHGGPVTPP